MTATYEQSCHDLWAKIHALIQRIEEAPRIERVRLQEEKESYERLLERLRQAVPTTLEPIAREPDPDGLVSDWERILLEAGQAGPTVGMAVEPPRPAARTLAPRQAFSPEFLALGDVPATLAQALNVGAAPTVEAPADDRRLTRDRR